MKKFKYDLTFLEYMNMLNNDAKFAKIFFAIFNVVFTGIAFYNAYNSYKANMDLTIWIFCISGICTWIVLGIYNGHIRTIESKLDAIIEKIEMIDSKTDINENN